MKQYTGECLCGACRYVIIAQKPRAMYICHCSRCRKETGTVCGANIFFKDAQLSWDKGEENITTFNFRGIKNRRSFCKTCGSPLPLELNKGNLMLPAGSLDADTQLEPTAHIFYASRVSWEDQLLNLKRFDEFVS